MKPMKYGKKMMIPVIAAASAHTNTAPAAMSFTCPAKGLRCGDTRSTSLSIAVFISSAAITSPIQSTIMVHSMSDISKKYPVASVRMAANR